MHFGTAYYPEHWPEDRWPEDIRLMEEAGFTVVRMGEFAWSRIEPAEGQYDLEWLEHAVSLLADENLRSVLGTPTAAPPAWLVQKYPDMMAVDETGRRVRFGGRCHYCVNSPEFQAATKRLVGCMGERFGDNPNVIGWQIDNEYNRVCHCDRCQRLFQGFLASKFESLEALNDHWSTNYWSQTYSAWEQIPIPIGYQNPGLLLAFKQFVTESYRRFQRLQLEELRKHLRHGVWTTHNFMGWYGGFDHYVLSQDLDLASWDWYVPTGRHDYLASGAGHDLTRGFKRRNFWLMETQPGSVNWGSINRTLDKGEARVMAWHAVGHGADAVLYWQWRSAYGGQEQYHGTLVDPSGQARPFYEEAQQLGRELRAAASMLEGSTTAAEVALLNDYESRWSIEFQPHHEDFDYVEHLLRYYRPLASRNIPVDIISADSPLNGYRLVIAPALIVMRENRIAEIKSYVDAGGVLALTVRTGMKDAYNALLPLRQPGPLADVAGIEVEEYFALLDPVPLGEGPIAGHSQLWAERIAIRDQGGTEVLARFGPSNGWLDGRPAVTVHRSGEGRVYFVAGCLDARAQESLTDHFLSAAGVDPILDTPAGVEACRRVMDDGQEVLILINHTPSEKRVVLERAVYEHLHGRVVEGELKLEPYDVSIVTWSDAVKGTLPGRG